MASVDKALIIDEPWISEILAGEKTWELRSTTCHMRGLIGLIRKGSGTVVGTATLVASHGPMDEAELQAAFTRHRVPRRLLQHGKYRYAWELAGANALRQPVRYQHPNGAVKWVRLKQEVTQAIASQCGTESGTPSPAVPAPTG